MCRLLEVENYPNPRSLPLPFMDSLLDEVAGKEMYTFLDGLSGYNQIKMALEGWEKTKLIIKWGVFMATIMMFGLKNALTTYLRMVKEIFYDYQTDFMNVFVDDFSGRQKRRPRTSFI